MFKILAIGDICGPSGVQYLRKNLWRIRKEHKADMVIANGENSAEPNGIDRESAEALFESGVDVITTGNHVYRKSSVMSYLDSCDALLRPLNFPSQSPGHGECIIKLDGYKILCMNVMGSAYMDSSACPFESVERCLRRNEGRYDFAILDIHAEATGEKKALAYDFASRLSVCFGTHTHIQTNDARVLEGRCGYITDLGMVGARESVLGVKKECVIYKMKTKMLTKFDFAEGEIEATGALFELDADTGKCLSARAVILA